MNRLLFILVLPLSIAGTQSLTPHQQLAREIFKELIEINTTEKVGCTKAAEAMAARLKVAGFPEADVQLLGPSQEHMNLVARFRGTGKKKPILFIGHLDVVEALPQDWSVNPFAFLEKDGYFYGRGTTDMKNEDADLVANFIRLKKEGFVPDRDLILALTEDEENGDANGVDWLVRTHRDLIDAEYCINPDAGGGDIKGGKRVSMGIQTSEKVYVTYQFEVKNKGGHSSLPVKDNAIYHLAGALDRLSHYDFPIRLNETTRIFFERTAARQTGQVRTDMLAFSRNPQDTAAANRLAAASAYYNALMRTTCIATLLNAGHAENALPQTARAVVNCRMLPDDNPERILATLKSIVADSQVVVTCPYVSVRAPLSPLRQDVLTQLEQVTASFWPEVTVTPVMSTGATDGRFLRVAGMPVYGVSGMFGDVDDVRAHGKDERIGVKEFDDGVEFMYRFLKLLAQY